MAEKYAKVLTEESKQTLTRSASDNGLADTSLFRSWATKSITGSGSMKAVDDISVKKNKLKGKKNFK